jgi:dGTPase
VNDVISAAQRDLVARRIACVAEVRAAPTIVQPSLDLAAQKAGLEAFLFERVYRHPDVLAKRAAAQLAMRESFDALVRAPDRLPTKFRRLAERDGVPRAVAHYLAGMTDRYAFQEHQRLME